MSDRLTFRADETLQKLLRRAMSCHRTENLSEYIRGIVLQDYIRTVGELPKGTRVEIPAWLTAEGNVLRDIGRTE